jgi:hypothetical protein
LTAIVVVEGPKIGLKNDLKSHDAPIEAIGSDREDPNLIDCIRG